MELISALMQAQRLRIEHGANAQRVWFINLRNSLGPWEK